VAIGHPAFDIGSLAYAYNLLIPHFDADEYRRIFRITKEEAIYSWKGFCDRIFAGLAPEVAAERKDLCERLAKLIFVKDFMQDVLLGVDSEGDAECIRGHLTSFVNEDMAFADRVIREWEA